MGIRSIATFTSCATFNSRAVYDVDQRHAWVSRTIPMGVSITILVCLSVNFQFFVDTSATDARRLMKSRRNSSLSRGLVHYIQLN